MCCELRIKRTWSFTLDIIPIKCIINVSWKKIVYCCCWCCCCTIRSLFSVCYIHKHFQSLVNTFPFRLKYCVHFFSPYLLFDFLWVDFPYKSHYYTTTWSIRFYRRFFFAFIFVRSLTLRFPIRSRVCSQSGNYLMLEVYVCVLVCWIAKYLYTDVNVCVCMNR